MKNQRMKTRQNSRLTAVAITLVMIAMLIGCFAVTAFAASGNVEVAIENLDFSGSNLTLTDGVYTKEYDGTVTVTGITASDVALAGIATGDDVKLNVVKAELNSATVADANVLRVYLSLTGADAAKYTVASYIDLPARVAPQTLYLAIYGVASADAVYQPNNPVYSGLTVENLPALVDKTGAAVGGVSIVTTTPYTATVQTNAAGTFTVPVAVALNDPNYRIDPVDVKVTIAPREITSIAWANDYTFEYGDDAAYAIKVFGYDADGNEYPLAIVYPSNYGVVTKHTITAQVSDPSLKITVDATKLVVITKKTYTVSLNDATYIATADGAQNAQSYALAVGGDLPADILARVTYTVDGKPFAGATKAGTYTVVATLPTSINYSFVDAQGNAVTSLTATLAVNKEYIAGGANGLTHQIIVTAENGVSANGTVSVTIPAEIARKALRGLRVHTAYTVQVNDVTGAYTVIIPISDALYANNTKALTAADIYLYDAATGTRVKVSEGTGFQVSVHEGYIQISGVTGNGARTFILAPESTTPFWLTAPGIAILVLLVLALLVLLFFIGLNLRRELAKKNAMLVIDTEGDVPAVVEGDAEELVDVDAALDENLEEIADALAEEETEETAEEDVSDLVADTMQELVDGLEDDEIDPVEFRKIVSAVVCEAMTNTMELPEDAFAEAPVEEVEETAEEAVEAPEETVEEPVEEAAEEAVAEEAVEAAEVSVEEAVEEAAETEEVVEETDDELAVCAVVADCVAEAFDRVTVDGVVPPAVADISAEKITDAVEAAAYNNIPGNWTVEVERAVKEAVAEELAARLLAAIATIAQVDEDDDDNDEDEDDGFDGFGPMPDTFIDVMEEPETYAALLEQERLGEVHLVTRYRRSFQSRLAQSQGNVQEYYSAIKNALLANKGVKNRVSWNYEAFNRGRAHVAKINAKSKTLYLYLALNPEELVDTKYTFVDVSSKKKYATVPVLMKIKGERKFKHALELIEMLCREKMELPALELPETDYTVPFQTTEELVQTGLVKKLVGAIPVTYFTETPAEPVAEAAEEAVPVSAATEQAEVTFVAPDNAPAVDAAAEELATETTPTEE